MAESSGEKTFAPTAKRRREAVERGVQQLRDVQRDNQRRLDDVNSKLEALKAIERSLTTRQPPPASSPNR